ncbi:hypothetical protein [Aliiruegeria sabulilitoris]|uniref:hypothetical protein n=1 Tax=Aliiruegeria sabulilitoris TaxID=1510458 RepID=UPI0009ECA57B|nr:hypothetical protein [Aliiruegeria sabulilitoris]
MLDTTASPETGTLNWQELLAVGDVVSYRFPVSEEDGTATPKVRPCLVLDVETIAGTTYALLAYGTTSPTRANAGYEIRVRAPKALRPAGLHRPTRFVGARRLLVPLDSAGFVAGGPAGTPMLGHLDGAAFDRMNEVRARIHAERDMAADRRASRRNGRGRSRAPRPFVVEHRHPRRITRNKEAS